MVRVEGKSSGVSKCALAPGVLERSVPFQKSSLEPIADEVAHDLVNKLTVIKCWTEVMLRRGLATGKGVEYLQKILGAVDRSVTLSEKLHAFKSPAAPGRNHDKDVSPTSAKGCQIGSVDGVGSPPRHSGTQA